MGVWCLISMAKDDVGSMLGKSVKGVEERRKETKGKKNEVSALSIPAWPHALRHSSSGFECDTQENRNCSMACIIIGSCAKSKKRGCLTLLLM